MDIEYDYRIVKLEESLENADKTAVTDKL